MTSQATSVQKTCDQQPVPGQHVPTPAAFPGQDAWRVLGWLIGFPVGIFVSATLASLLFGNVQQGSIGAFVCIGLTYMVGQGISTWLVNDRGKCYFRRLAENEPDDADARIQASLWIVASASGPQELAEAARLCRQALRISPDQRAALITLGAVLLQSKDYQATIDLLDSWLRSRSDVAGEGLLAEAYQALGDHVRAALHYQNVLNIFPATPKRAEIERYLRDHDK